MVVPATKRGVVPALKPPVLPLAPVVSVVPAMITPMVSLTRVPTSLLMCLPTQIPFPLLNGITLLSKLQSFA